MQSLQFQNDDNMCIRDRNVAALYSFFHQGDFRTATLTLLSAIREVRSSTVTKTVDQKPTTEHLATGAFSDMIVNEDHRHDSLVPTMTIATSWEDSMSRVRRNNSYSRSALSSSSSSTRPMGPLSNPRSEAYIYSKPFLIVAHTHTAGPAASTVPPEICASLLFNLGLIYHLSGTQNKSSCGDSLLLRKALFCYEQALKQLRHGRPRSVAVLVAAICHNRLHLCHHYFYDSIRGREQLHLLNDALKYIEYTYISRIIDGECRTRSNYSKQNVAANIQILMDPNNVTQTISVEELHRLRLTYSFTKLHDFRLSPAA